MPAADVHPAIAEAKRVLEVEAAAILSLIEHLDDAFVNVVELIDACKGRVVTMGLGKSGIICKKIGATLASTGTPSFFLHPAEAIHGDLGMVVKGDVALAISNSGETEELVRLLPSLKRIGAHIVAITGNPNSPLAPWATPWRWPFCCAKASRKKTSRFCIPAESSASASSASPT